MARLITPRTKGILIANPNNPTGSIADTRTLDAIVALAKEHNLLLLSDEIYDKLTFDNTPIASLAARAEGPPLCHLWRHRQVLPRPRSAGRLGHYLWQPRSRLRIRRSRCAARTGPALLQLPRPSRRGRSTRWSQDHLDQMRKTHFPHRPSDARHCIDRWHRMCGAQRGVLCISRLADGIDDNAFVWT